MPVDLPIRRSRADDRSGPIFSLALLIILGGSLGIDAFLGTSASLMDLALTMI